MTAPERPGISVIIPNYNGRDLLRKYLPNVIGVARQYAGDIEIIVVDDASVDDSLEVLEAFRDLRVITRPENGGFPEACNTGLAEARHPILCFLNTDVWLEDGFFEHAVPHFRDPRCFAVTAHGLREPDGMFIDGAMMMRLRGGSVRTAWVFSGEDLEARGIQEPFWSFRVQGAYFFVDAVKMRELGGFLGIYAPFYWEETDLSMRARRRGWEIVYEPRCRAHHEHGTSIVAHSSRLRSLGIAKRNRILFHVINIHDRWWFARHVLSIAVNLLTFKPTNWYGLWKALPLLPRAWGQRRAERAAVVRTDRELFVAQARFLAGERVHEITSGPSPERA